MISRKDNLLVRPWQQLKFENHRRKVQSALPAIDTGPPAYRSHVAIKQKKRQKESERCKKIERDNFLLLQKMNYIMKTSRVDNCWRIPQPNFLNRVAIYNLEPKIESINYLTEKTDIQKSRRSRCSACNPIETEIKIPEERVPWEPLSKPIVRTRSKSVPIKKSDAPLPSIRENSVSTSKPNSSKMSERHHSIDKVKLDNTIEELRAKESQNIVLTRGCLKLYVNFPSDTVVKFQKGNVEKLLMREICHCKNSPTTLC